MQLWLHEDKNPYKIYALVVFSSIHGSIVKYMFYCIA